MDYRDHLQFCKSDWEVFKSYAVILFQVPFYFFATKAISLVYSITLAGSSSPERLSIWQLETQLFASSYI